MYRWFQLPVKPPEGKDVFSKACTPDVEQRVVEDTLSRQDVRRVGSGSYGDGRQKKRARSHNASATTARRVTKRPLRQRFDSLKQCLFLVL